MALISCAMQYPCCLSMLLHNSLYQFSSVLSRVQLFATPWTAARQASLSITNSWRLSNLTSFESVMPSNHLILCRPLLLLPSIFPSIRATLTTQQLSKEGIKSRIIQLPCVIGGCFYFAICIHSFFSDSV